MNDTFVANSRHESESERMSPQPAAPVKRVQAKQTITKNGDAKFVSIVSEDACTPKIHRLSSSIFP
jgi:hypothetical protein